MFQPSAEIIADSVNPWGTRLTTFLLTYPRFIHAEMLRHRAFSRCVSSSRAIPIAKMIKAVQEAELYPSFWGAAQKGMAADREVSEETRLKAIAIWDDHREATLKATQALADLGLHKQIPNRFLEPFAPATELITATEYQNFFELRDHPTAQPEIQAIAKLMRKAYASSKAKECEVGQWHIPFIDPVKDLVLNGESVLQVAVGRCARLSYLTHDGDRDPQEDINLCDRLWTSKPKHLSPFEHVARVAPWRVKCDNFDEWASLRHELRVGALKYENGKIMEDRRG
jgi:thymidylate synthase ThyX